MAERECEFSSPAHPAEYVIIDLEDEDAIQRLTCEKDLADMIHWRFVNHAPGVAVTRMVDA